MEGYTVKKSEKSCLFSRNFAVKKQRNGPSGQSLERDFGGREECLRMGDIEDTWMLIGMVS